MLACKCVSTQDICERKPFEYIESDFVTVQEISDKHRQTIFYKLTHNWFMNCYVCFWLAHPCLFFGQIFCCYPFKAGLVPKRKQTKEEILPLKIDAYVYLISTNVKRFHAVYIYNPTENRNDELYFKKRTCKITSWIFETSFSPGLDNVSMSSNIAKRRFGSPIGWTSIYGALNYARTKL